VKNLPFEPKGQRPLKCIRPQRRPYSLIVNRPLNGPQHLMQSCRLVLKDCGVPYRISRKSDLITTSKILCKDLLVKSGRRTAEHMQRIEAIEALLSEQIC